MVRNHKNRTDNLRSINPLPDSQEQIAALCLTMSLSLCPSVFVLTVTTD